MDREILFRGKRTDNGKWVEGSVLQSGNGYVDIVPFDNSICEDEFGALCVMKWYEVDPETVCQYTGLTDKDGRKIFEGDIVKYGNTTHKVVFENRFNTAYFGIVFEDRGEVWSFGHMCSPLDMTVISNIFDNPELLEGEE